jgi:hypothetical protein
MFLKMYDFKDRTNANLLKSRFEILIFLNHSNLNQIDPLSSHLFYLIIIYYWNWIFARQSKCVSKE